MKGAVSLNLDFDYVTLERWGDALQQILAVRVNDHLQKKFRKPSTIGEVRKLGRLGVVLDTNGTGLGALADL